MSGNETGRTVLIMPVRLTVAGDVILSGANRFRVTGWEPILPGSRVLLTVTDLATDEQVDVMAGWYAEYVIADRHGGDGE